MLRNVSPFGHHLSEIFLWLSHVHGFPSLLPSLFEYHRYYYEPIKFRFDVGLKNEKIRDHFIYQ